MADVTIINQAAGTSVNFKHAMQGLTNSGGSLRTLTDEMVDKWGTLATTGGANQPGTPRMSFTLEPKSNVNTENIAHSVELTPQQLIQAVQELYTVTGIATSGRAPTEAAWSKSTHKDL